MPGKYRIKINRIGGLARYFLNFVFLTHNSNASAARYLNLEIRTMRYLTPEILSGIPHPPSPKYLTPLTPSPPGEGEKGLLLLNERLMLHFIKIMSFQIFYSKLIT